MFKKERGSCFGHKELLLVKLKKQYSGTYEMKITNIIIFRELSPWYNTTWKKNFSEYLWISIFSFF